MVKASGSKNRKKKAQLATVNHKLSQSMAKFVTMSPRQKSSCSNDNRNKSSGQTINSEIIILDDTQSTHDEIVPILQFHTESSEFFPDNSEPGFPSDLITETVLNDSELNINQSENVQDSLAQQSSGFVVEGENVRENIVTETEIFSQITNDDFEMSVDGIESASLVNCPIPSDGEASPSFSSHQTDSSSTIWDDDFSDAGKWPNVLNDKIKSLILCTGPHQLTNSDFPKDNNGRKFTTSMYYTKTKTGEDESRKWLVYSKEKNSVFCFPCKIFLPGQFQLASEFGYSDWRNVSKFLKEHEESKHHKESCMSWSDYLSRSKSGTTIEMFNLKRIHTEINRWTNVFERLMGITKYLGQHNLAFRGSRDVLYTDNNGNFLGLVELLAQFDSVMSQHTQKVISKQIPDHYLSKTIQNELIQTIATSTQNLILDWCKKAKYYAIIVDCTRDISRIEQMTISIRFVQTSMETVVIEEHFICFAKAESSTGEGLTDNILNVLKNLGLDIDNCRGQGYDGGANMAGKNKGVQKRILEINPRAFFLPCAAHKLNLVLLDAAESCVLSTTFFGTIQAIYVFFSASTSRWSILMKHLPTFTLKPLSDTRWEAKIKSVQAFKFQLGNIYDALLEIFDSTKDADTKFQAQN